MTNVNNRAEYEFCPLENLESIPTLGYSASVQTAEIANVLGDAYPERLESGLLVAASFPQLRLRRSDRRTLGLDFVTAQRFGHENVAKTVLGDDLKLTNHVLIPRIKGASSTCMGVYFNRHSGVRNERQLAVYMNGDTDSGKALAIASVTIRCVGGLLLDRYENPSGDIEVLLERYGTGRPTEFRTFTPDEFRALPTK